MRDRLHNILWPNIPQMTSYDTSVDEERKKERSFARRSPYKTLRDLIGGLIVGLIEVIAASALAALVAVLCLISLSLVIYGLVLLFT